MSALQTWIFAMRYLLSAAQCSLSRLWFNPWRCYVIGAAGALVYSITITIVFICAMITFPGYTSEYDTWVASTFENIYTAFITIWAVMINVSTVINVYAISIISQTNKVL